MFGLIWWLLFIGSIVAISFVVYEVLTTNNIASYLRQHNTEGATEWFVDEIKSADRIIIGLKKNGKKVAGADVSCPEGHRLRVGNSGWL
jgi:hypothetical protein